jgi:hypothetical protein
MRNFSWAESNYLVKYHPFILEQSLHKYYLLYLTGLFPFNIKGKIIENIKQKDCSKING